MTHPSSPALTRRRDTHTAAAARGSRFVRAGEKDAYDPTNPADLIEYQTVVNYRQP